MVRVILRHRDFLIAPRNSFRQRKTKGRQHEREQRQHCDHQQMRRHVLKSDQIGSILEMKHGKQQHEVALRTPASPLKCTMSIIMAPKLPKKTFLSNRWRLNIHGAVSLSSSLR